MDSDCKDKGKLLRPPQFNNFFSNIFFCWTIPIFKTALKKELSEEDFFQVLAEHESAQLVNQLESYWDEQLKFDLKPSLWKAIWRLFKGDIILSMALYFVAEILIKTSGLLALGKLMGFYALNGPINKNETIIYGVILIVAGFLDAVSSHNFVFICQQVGMKVRVATSSLIYRKSLRLGQSALSETTMGHIINLLSNDIFELVRFAGSFNAIWSAPLQSVIILYLLYYIAGPTALVGIVFIAFLTPLQLLMSKKSAFYRLKIALKSDERIRYMSEVITGIQVIKMYAWEKSFVKLIEAVRRKEVGFIKMANYLDALSNSFAFFVDRAAIFLCILTYVLTGSVPQAQYVFVVSSFYYMLMGAVSFQLPDAVSDVLKAKISIQRIESFLDLDELKYQNKHLSCVGVKINDAAAKWSKTSTRDTLSNICFNANPNQVVAIVGPIASGKFSLLQLLLSEMSLVSGTVEVGGMISYASQEPWLFASSIRENIIFGQVMVREKYNKVIRMCALADDLAHFPNGDNTVVGERGVLLSGGQKARIGLARAIYKDADIYLLDDPLSAVDAVVGKQIFTNCICNYLKHKCTILVTHQLQYLSAVNKIYLVINGRVAASGSLDELQKSGQHFAQLLTNTEKPELDEKEIDKSQEKKIKTSAEKKYNGEATALGKVSRKVYNQYIQACGGYSTVAFTAFLFVLTEISATGSDYFIAFWVNMEQKQNYHNNSIFTTEISIYTYSSIIGGLIVLAIFISMFYIKSCMRASICFHDKMFSSIVSTTMKFFYSNSSGRVLNRFAKDIGSVDNTLPAISMNAFQVFLLSISDYFLIFLLYLTLAGSVTVMAICIVSPWTVLPSIVIFIIMYFIRTIYLASSRTIKRIESTNRSPIFAHVAESMKGLTTIRASGSKQILEREFVHHQNAHTSIYNTHLSCNRAFATWLDTVCVIYVLCVTIIALAKESYGGNVGFVITQAMSLTEIFQWGIRQWSELENQMTSVERIIEYVEVEQESNEGDQMSSSWPTKGAIELKAVCMKYSANDPFVLENLNVFIRSKEKVGIVGRTGAGKSSLISVLFRLVNFGGDILIDGINTKSVVLSALRLKISIIPQEPLLFSGTLRKNLDPFDQYTDDKIWNILEQAKLKDFVEALSLGLQSNMSENGSNLSVGQKQLVCLARALLSNNKILVLDEATANVDPQTDELLQKTIRERFSDSTVLTIAHRLHTVMDSEKVLVMDMGRAVEFDHPFKLIEKKEVFYSLVMETGSKMGEALIDIAQKNYTSKT